MLNLFRGMAAWPGILACLILLAFPCPVHSGFGEFTIRDEQELARKFDLIIETRFPVVHDTRITGYVQALVDRLVAAMPPQPFPIKVTVVQNVALNAFASAAGHITIFTGLIANMDDEDELASVIAHELAHVSERHIAKSIEKSQLVGAGSLRGILAGVLVGSQGGGDAAGWSIFFLLVVIVAVLGGVGFCMLRIAWRERKHFDPSLSDDPLPDSSR